jgi:hypothetical protein
LVRLLKAKSARIGARQFDDRRPDMFRPFLFAAPECGEDGLPVCRLL